MSADELAARRRRTWARRMIRAADGPLPRYGDTAWLALPDGDRRKVAAVVIAAEAWARDADQLARHLRDEITAGRNALLAVEAEAHAATARDVRAHSGSPSHAAIADRRGDHDEADRARLRAIRLADSLASARTGGAA